MMDTYEKACHDLGKVIFESHLAEAFGIFPDQKIDLNSQTVLSLLGFYLIHTDESIAMDKTCSTLANVVVKKAFAKSL